MERFAGIPGGIVHLTDARRGSERTVELAPFAITRTVVTRSEFDAGRLDSRLDRSALDRTVLDRSAANTNTPAHGVTWLDAVAWCNAASVTAGLTPAYQFDGPSPHWNPTADGFRLPTEAEWVHAAMGGSPGPRHGAIASIGWSALDRVAGPQPVGQKAPNAYGVYDSIGNVWEWCWDRLDPARYGNYRVFKGGGWADPEWSCRVGVRRGNAPDAVVEDVGFRVARGFVAAHETSDGGQGWSEAADRTRASLPGPLPVGWTPLTE